MDNKRCKLSILNLRQREGNWTEKEIHSPGDHLGHRLRASFERNMDGIYPRACPKAFRAQMSGGADTYRRKVQCARLRLSGCDQIAGCFPASGRWNDQYA